MIFSCTPLGSLKVSDMACLCTKQKLTRQIDFLNLVFERKFCCILNEDKKQTINCLIYGLPEKKHIAIDTFTSWLLPSRNISGIPNSIKQLLRDKECQ